MTKKDNRDVKTGDYAEQEESIAMATKPKSESELETGQLGETPMQEDVKKPTTKLEVVKDGEAPMTVAKPSKFNLNKFKSKQTTSVAGGVETLQTALPHGNLAGAKDFVRLHPNEDEYWSSELCFVNVPIKGQKKDTLHLIDEDVAKKNGVHQAKLKYFRLALASKPHDVFFLCEVPSRNQDNTWVSSNLEACEQAKRLWTQALSQKEQGVESYKVDAARNPSAFPEPKWPSQSLEELIGKTFAGRMIEDDDHPGLARLVGDTPTIS
jgi:hypothetical protein